MFLALPNPDASLLDNIIGLSLLLTVAASILTIGALRRK